MESIRERLRRLRIERGLAQRELAGPGVSYAYVNRIEHGQRNPSIRALRTIAAQLGVLPEYLETGKNETATDRLAAEVVKLSDGAVWIVLTKDGATMTWQHAGDRYQFDPPNANLTEVMLGALDRAEELLRLDVEEERIVARREEIGRAWAAPE
jgi:transcriptional regulator with XRE-family HTH domain